MSMPNITTLRASAAVASLLALSSLPAMAAAPPLQVVPAAAPSAILKHLPAGHDELTFRGETTRRSWPIYLARGDIERTRTFQLALKSTVALLPDRSTLKLSINGHLLATLPVRSSENFAVLPVAIPPGVLVPGFNSVDVSVVMEHRVDCSVAATYELWTQLDPAQTGFVLPAGPSSGVRSIDDIAGEPLAEDGTTRIALRTTDLGDAAAIGRASLFIEALVHRANLARPVVQIGPDAGRGPGFDVVITTAGARDDVARNLRIMGREDAITFARNPANDRLVLILSGADTADLDRQIAAFAARGARLPLPGPAGEVIVDGETLRSFADLGLPTESFSGRHYTSSLDVVLPSDFYPANYDKAQLLIDSAYSAGIDRDSDLVFRVNGSLVSSLRLGPDRGGVLQHEQVDLPLRFFHPGHNEIALEAVTSTPADRQCDTAGLSHDVRFTLSGSSEIAFPRFAHLGTIPQIPGAMAGARPNDGRVDVYLPNADPASVGAGLTILANMAGARRDAGVPTIHLAMPKDGDVPGLVVAPYDGLPPSLANPVRSAMAIPDRTQPFGPTMDDGIKGSFAANDARQPLGIQPGVGSADEGRGRFDPRRLMDEVRRGLKSQGFFFGSDQGGQAVPFTAHSLMIAAVEPRSAEWAVPRVDLPRFTTDKAQWLVVTAADAGILHDGLLRLVSDGQWKALDGQAVSLDIENGHVASIQPSRVLYVAPDQLVLSDVRPILGGIVSNHIEISLAALMLLMTILGISTHSLIRRSGSK